MNKYTGLSDEQWEMLFRHAVKTFASEVINKNLPRAEALPLIREHIEEMQQFISNDALISDNSPQSERRQ